MPFVSECPSCGQKLKVPDNLTGKKVRCSKCAATFVAESITAKPPSAPLPAPAAARTRARPRDEEADERADDRDRPDEDDRPERRSRRRRDRDDGGGPGRGGMLLTFGIISIAMPIVGFLFSFIMGMVFPPLALCSWVLIIVGLVMGIMAWVMGSGDLKRIRSGQIDSAAQGGTKGGYITGIIGTILNVLYILCNCIVVILALAGVAALAGMAGQQQQQKQNQPFAPAPRRTFQLPLPRLSHDVANRHLIGVP